MSKAKTIEQRRFALELRAAQEEGTIEGYAAVFNKPSSPIGGVFTEVIRPGAFTKTLQESKDIFAFFNHDPGHVLGRTKNQTLELRQDERGLWFKIQLPDTTWAQDLRSQMLRGDIDKMSIGFIVPKDKAKWTRNGKSELREIFEVRLVEISVVAMPAYEDTHAVARAASSGKTSRLDEFRRLFGLARRKV